MTQLDNLAMKCFFFKPMTHHFLLTVNRKCIFFLPFYKMYQAGPQGIYLLLSVQVITVKQEYLQITSHIKHFPPINGSGETLILMAFFTWSHTSIIS